LVKTTETIRKKKEKMLFYYTKIFLYEIISKLYSFLKTLFYLEVLLRETYEFDCDDKPTVMLDFLLVPLLYDWLNCLPDRFGIAIDDCGKGIEAAGWGRGSASVVL